MDVIKSEEENGIQRPSEDQSDSQHFKKEGEEIECDSAQSEDEDVGGDCDEKQNNISECIVELSDNEKNNDGTISEKGKDKINSETWNDYQWDCCYCFESFTNVNDLRGHCSNYHAQQMFQYFCSDCSKVFSKYIMFITHVRVSHRPHLKFCCDICSTYFWDLKMLRAHRYEHSNKDRSLLCQTCGKECRSHSTLQLHRRSHLPSDKKTMYECDICFKQFGTKPNLTTHKRIHAGWCYF